MILPHRRKEMVLMTGMAGICQRRLLIMISLQVRQAKK